MARTTRSHLAWRAIADLQRRLKHVESRDPRPPKWHVMLVLVILTLLLATHVLHLREHYRQYLRNTPQHQHQLAPK